MGFFDTIVNAADSFGAKVTGNVDAMGINSQVQAKEKEMNDLFAQLGAAYYSNHKDDPEDACRNLVQLLMNKEAELAKLKGDLAAKKAETAAISYTQPQNSPAQSFGQPMGQQPTNQGFNQPMGQQPTNQGFNQPMGQQPMNQGFGQPMNQQPMNQGFNQPMNQQPANQGFGAPMGQPMNNQSMGQSNNNQPTAQFPSFFDKKDDAPASSGPAPLGPLPSMNASSEEKKEEVKEEAKEEAKEEVKEDAPAASEEKADAPEGKTCSKCGATGQSGAFCGQCGNKLD